MSDELAALGVDVTDEEDSGLVLRSAHRDWLLSVFRTFSLRAEAHGPHLRVATRDRAQVTRIVGAALAPQALLFDLDGVLADLSRRRPLAAAEDLAALARDHGVGVVTTCPRRLAESVLERYGFLAHVGAVVGSEDGPCKPDPAPVRLAMERLGVERAWMLGDNPSDVTAARGAQAVPFAVTPRGIGAESHLARLRGAGAVRFVDGVAELRALREA